MAVVCTYTFTPLPHACTSDEVDDCKRQCDKKPYCGCVVALEIGYDCADIDLENDTEIFFGGEIDFTTCLCKTRRPSKAERKARRRAFDRDKARLIKDWEEEHDVPWPTDPDTGFKCDAHHLDEIQYGGRNTVDNLAPLPPAAHRLVHELYRRLRANC
jgi:hypothetical protein